MQYDALDRKIDSTLLHRIEHALAFLRTLQIDRYENGRYEGTDGIFFLVQRYETKAPEEIPYEAHRNYIDIQYLCAGEECIYAAPIERMTPKASFDEARDIGFYEDCPEYSTLRLSAGEYGIFYPWDCHKPSIHLPGEKSQKVEKIVVKVPAMGK